jgi:hypothetical protein
VLEEAIDVDRCPAPRELQMLLGREPLLAEEDDAVLDEGRLNLVPLTVAHGFEIDAQHFGAAAACQLANLDGFVGHCSCSSGP